MNSSAEAKQMEKSIVYLTEVETLAQDILTARQQKLELSNAKNKFNEGLRALERCEEKNTLVDFDRTLFQFPKKVAVMLLKDDIASATEDIDKLHGDIKRKAMELRDLEHQPKIVGIGLKPLSGFEAKAIHKAYGADG